MEHLKIDIQKFPLAVEGLLAITSKDFNTIVEYLKDIVDYANALKAENDALKARVETAEAKLIALAKILEEVYEKI